MIQRITDSDKDVALELIEQKKYQNVYLYIDAVSYGFSDDNIESFFVIEDEQTFAIIYILR